MGTIIFLKTDKNTKIIYTKKIITKNKKEGWILGVKGFSDEWDQEDGY